MAVLNSLNIYFDDTAGIRVQDLRAKCRKLKQENRLDFVVIDYLQLIQESGVHVEIDKKMLQKFLEG